MRYANEKNQIYRFAPCRPSAGGHPAVRLCTARRQKRYDFKLFDAEGNNLYTWSAGKMFIAVMDDTQLAPGEETVFSDTLDAAAFAAVDKAVSMQAFIIGSSEDFTIDQNGYMAVITK